MFKAARWRSEKNKIKAVFKLQFQATQIPPSGSEAAAVSLVPLDVRKPTARSERVAVNGGTCNWLNPIYETVKLVRDPKSGKINEKFYQFLVSTTGSTKAGFLGEGTLNLADYVEVFKASSVSLPLKAGAILHVTIQRMHGDISGREAEENGDATVRQQGKTLQSQLNMCDNEEVTEALNGRNDMNFVKAGLHIDRETQLKFQSSRNLPTYGDSSHKLQRSHSFGAISATSSDSSSDIYTPRANNTKNNNQKDSTSLLSPLANIDLQPKLMTSSGDWSGTSVPDRSTDGSTDNSGESGLTERLQCSGDILEKLRRKVEVSELELQTLRKQIIKENKRGHDLSRELSSLKEERDALRKECDELKLPQKRTNVDEKFSTESQLNREDPLSMLEEMKQELDHEKNLNSSLHLQLQKTQEANSELLLAVRDLDELLEQKNRETTCCKCSNIGVKAENDENYHDIEFGNRLQYLQQSECEQELLETTLGHEKAEQELGAIDNDHNHMSGTFSVEKKIIELNCEVELYKKDREDLEMQMEQLALDYEILKQENHDISYKLEQTQFREQLRMQYECSAHSAIINDLEAHVECLERDLQSQAESFESDVETIMQAKVEQEKKVIQAEEVLMRTKWNNAKTAERLHGELKMLSSQVSAVFYANEKIVKQALKEASELRSQRSHLEKLLEKAKGNLVSLQCQYRMNLQQLLSLLDLKSKETDKLLLQIKSKNEELENYKSSEEQRLKDSLEKMQLLYAEIEKLEMEKCLISEQKENLVAEMENLETDKMMLQDKNSENEILKNAIALLKQEVEKSSEEINDLRIMRDEKETMITMLNSEVETLGLQYNDLKQSLPEGELEKEKLRRLVSNLTGGLLKEGDVNSSEEELGNSHTNGETRLIHSSVQKLTNKINGVKDVERTEDKDCYKFSKRASINEYPGDVDCLRQPGVGDKEQINKISGKDVARSSETNLAEKQHTVSCKCDQHKVAEVLNEMAVLKEKNESMEADLKDMQERYSEISLKFAEVEGERQQLVMTIRTLKNALKN